MARTLLYVTILYIKTVPSDAYSSFPTLKIKLDLYSSLRGEMHGVISYLVFSIETPPHPYRHPARDLVVVLLRGCVTNSTAIKIFNVIKSILCPENV